MEDSQKEITLEKGRICFSIIQEKKFHVSQT